MTSKRTALDENLDPEPIEDSPAIAPFDTQAEKTMAEKKIEFYKAVQAMRRESRTK
ncbi:MAG: hypothetical protein HY911_09755 [Desulfobacterales bacterium]|nr:hypothetical protein [Desulfobacterales bacterium]